MASTRRWSWFFQRSFYQKTERDLSYTRQVRGPATTISAFTSSRRDPSSRFRTRQLIGPLRSHGYHVIEHCPAFSKYSPAWVQLTGLPMLSRVPGLLAARTTRRVWLNGELVSGWAGWECLVGGTRLLDLDDALWVSHGKSFLRKLARLSHAVVVANDYLASHLRPWHDRIWVVPTCIDVERWKPAPADQPGRPRPWTIGWSGTSWNLPYLYGIADALAAFLRRTPDTRLLVVCDRKPRLPSLPADRWTYLPWSEQAELDGLHQMDLGIMPLPDDEWTRGKSGFKMLSYMAVGLPHIASPVGVVATIMDRADVGYRASHTGEWSERLGQAWEERGQGPSVGRRARDFVARHHSAEVGATMLADIFAQVFRDEDR